MVHLQILLCVVFVISLNFICKGDALLGEVDASSIACDTVFPKVGDFLFEDDQLYTVILCYLSQELKEILRKNNNECEVDVNIFGGFGSRANGPSIPSVRVRVGALFVHSAEDDGVNIVEQPILFHFSIALPLRVTGVNRRVKILYRISIKSEVVVAQTSTMIHLSHPSQEYLQRLMEGKNLTLPTSLDPSKLHKSFDFIEIGTSFFDTLLEKASDSQTGISIEPLSCHQELLPNKPHVIKVNAGLDARRVDTEADLRFVVFKSLYYLDPEFLKARIAGAQDESSRYLFGLSSFGSIQEAVLQYAILLFGHRKLDVPFLATAQVMFKYQVGAVRVLKVDCEGHDARIVQSFLDFSREYSVALPCIIQYEAIATEHNREDLSGLLPTLSTDYDVYWLAADNVAVRRGCSETEISSISNLLSPALLLMLSVCRSGGGDISRECCMYVSGDNYKKGSRDCLAFFSQAISSAVPPQSEHDSN